MVESQEKSFEFKLAILGDKGVGKTAFINTFLEPQTDQKYDQNTGFSMKSVQATYNKNKFTFNILEVQSLEDTEKSKLEESGDSQAAPKSEYPYESAIQGSQCAIIIFEVISRISYKNVPKYYRDLVRICDNIPIVLVGSKVDNKDRKVKAKQIMFHRKKNLMYYDLMYYEISSPYNYHVELPIQFLAKKLLGDASIQLPIELKPPSLILDENLNAMLAEYEQHLKQANDTMLPDEDDN